MSSLASQLAALRPLNAAALTSESRKQPSYLFTARQAASQTFNDIHAVGHNGFLALVPREPDMAEAWSELEEPLFGEAAKQIDRTLLDQAANQKLDGQLEALLRLLGPSVLSRPCGQVLEWLIRRFRINQFNVGAVLGLFLPYHETPQFARMLQLLHIENDSVFSALSAVKSTAGSLPRHILVTHMAKSIDLFRFVATLLPRYLEAGTAHRNLVAFWMATLTALLDLRKALIPGEMAVLLPAILDAMSHGEEDNKVLRFSRSREHPDLIAYLGQLAAYVVIARLATTVSFTEEALKTFVTRLVQSRNTITREHETASEENDEAMLGTLTILLAQQEELSRLPDKAITALLKIPDIAQQITRLASKCDMTRLLRPLACNLAQGSAQRGETHTFVLTHLIHHMKSDDFMQACAEALLSAAIEDDMAGPHCITLLSLIWQRDPAAYERACSLQAEGGHADQIDLLMAGIPEAEGVALIASAPGNESKRSRLIQLRDLLADENVSPDYVGDQLKLHLRDHDPEIVKAALDEKLLERCDPSRLLDMAALAFRDNDASKTSLATYCRFLCGPFLNRYQDRAGEIVFRVLWPRLLVAKSTKKTNMAVWSSLQASSLVKSGLLAGCVTSEIEMSPAQNRQIAGNLAVNIISILGGCGEYIRWIREHLETSGPSSLLAKWVLIAMCRENGGKPTLGILCEVLQYVFDAGLSIDIPVTTSDVTEDTEAAVYAKTLSMRTSNRLDAHLLLGLTDCLRMPDQTVPWLMRNEGTAQEPATFRKAAGLAYQLARGAMDQSFTGALMRNLFRALSNDAPVFLVTGAIRTDWSLPLRMLALQDASVVLRKRSCDPLPTFVALLPLLRDSHHRVRQASVTLLRSIREQMAFGCTSTLHNLYGSEIQVLSLSQEDANEYLNALLQREGEIAMEQSGIAVAHGALQGSIPRTISQFLLSHASATSDPMRRLSLLEITSRMSSSQRLAASEPLLQDLDDMVQHLSLSHARRYTELVFSAYANPVRRFEGNSAKAFQILKDRISGTGDALVQRVAIDTLQDLFPELNKDARFDMMRMVISTLASGSSAAPTELRVCANSLAQDLPTMKLCLELESQTSAMPAVMGMDRLSKRSKSTAAESTLVDIAAISTLLELVDAAHDDTAGLSSLIVPLFGLLSRLVDLVGKTEVSFAAQLAVRLISGIFSRLDDPGKFAHVVRVDVVVNLLKDTSSPSLARYALLLVSQLTDIVSTQIIPYVMPIFTFVGHNMLSRDDAASLRVIEQTIDSIVPSLVRSIRPGSTDRSHLVASLRDVMSIFANASAHVPLHKRIPLYSRLASALGAHDFLGPLCMLLVDRQANKLAKAQPKSSEARDLLDLPLAVLAGFEPRYQLTAFGQMVDEVRTQIAAKAETVESPFLVGANEKEGVSKRHLNALIAAIHFGITSKQLSSKITSSRAQGALDVDVGLQEIAKKLIVAMSSATFNASLRPRDIEELKIALRDDLESLVSLTTPMIFSEVLLWLADSSSLTILLNALALLRSQVPLIKPAKRKDISPAINAILRRLSTILSKVESSNAKQTPEMLQTVVVLASSATSEEHALLSHLLGVLLEMGKRPNLHHRVALELLLAVAAIPSALGPRLLGQLSIMLQFALPYIPHLNDTSGAEIQAAAYSLLDNLVTALPSFVGPHLALILEKVLTANVAVPSASLVPELETLWSTLPPSDTTALLAYVSFLSRVNRLIKTEGLGDVYKALFRLFLKIFDYRRASRGSVSMNDVASVERAAVVIFVQMTLKLSDKAFRPLFLRAVDWALVEVTGKDRLDRALTLFRLLDRLLVQLKDVVSPYYAFVLDTALDILQDFANDVNQSLELWRLVASSLTLALLHGADGYWNTVRLQRLIAPAVNQLKAAARLGSDNVSSVAGPLIVQLAVTCAEHEVELKAVNFAVLERMRDDSDQTAQIAAVRTLEAIWHALGDAMSTHVPETLPIILECLEGEAAVEKATRSLVQTMETAMGEALLDSIGSPSLMSANLKGVIVDLSGTLHIGDQVTPKAAEALKRLKERLPESRASLLKRLDNLGLHFAEGELFSSLAAAAALCAAKRLCPLLLLSDSAKDDFRDVELPSTSREANAVVVGLAPHALDYRSLNAAFRVLIDKGRDAQLIATHRALYMKDEDGELSLGPGGFVSALEQASDKTAEVVGKPEEGFFRRCLQSLESEGVYESDWKHIAIVGDDYRNDLGGGAEQLGLQRFLVRTGKYREGDESKAAHLSGVYDDFASFVDAVA